MNTTEMYDETEINLVEFLWKLLIQWKPILLTALICAVLVGGYKYVSDSKAASAVSADERTEEDIEKTISEEDMEAVETAFQTKQYVEALTEYQDESPLMNLDPYNERIVSITYYIENIAGLNSSELDVIYSQYAGYIKGTDFATDFAENLDWKYDAKYVSELVSVGVPNNGNVYSSVSASDSSGGRALVISVIIPDDTVIESVDDAVTEALTGYTIADERFTSGYTLYQMDAQEQVRIDTGTASTQSSNATTLTNKKTELKTAEDALEGDALALYNMYTADENDGSAANEAEETTQSKAVSISLKYVAIGFVLGCILYVGVLFVLYILKPTVSRITDVEGMLPGKNAGRIADRSGSGNAFVNSPFVQRLHEGDTRPVSEQAEEVSTAIDFKVKNAKKPEAGLSYLYWADITDAHRSILSAFSDGAKMTELPINDREATYKILDDVENAVLIFEDEHTPMKRVREVLELLRENRSDVVAYMSLE